MPFKSKAQQRWMFANKPAMAERWAKETKDFKHLPEHVKTEKKADAGYAPTLEHQSATRQQAAPLLYASGGGYGRALKQQAIPMAHASDMMGQLGKLAAELGPYGRDQAANVVGDDNSIAAMRSNWHEHPYHYLFNPFVKGPLTEVLTRLHRRMSAGAGHSWGGTVAAPIGDAIVPGLGSGVQAFMGGPAAKTQLRQDLPETIKGFGEADADKAKAESSMEAKKSKGRKKKAAYFGKLAAVIDPVRMQAVQSLLHSPAAPQGAPQQNAGVTPRAQPDTEGMLPTPETGMASRMPQKSAAYLHGLLGMVKQAMAKKRNKGGKGKTPPAFKPIKSPPMNHSTMTMTHMKGGRDKYAMGPSIDTLPVEAAGQGAMKKLMAPHDTAVGAGALGGAGLGGLGGALIGKKLAKKHPVLGGSIGGLLGLLAGGIGGGALSGKLSPMPQIGGPSQNPIGGAVGMLGGLGKGGRDKYAAGMPGMGGMAGMGPMPMQSGPDAASMGVGQIGSGTPGTPPGGTLGAGGATPGGAGSPSSPPVESALGKMAAVKKAAFLNVIRRAAREKMASLAKDHNRFIAELWHQNLMQKLAEHPAVANTRKEEVHHGPANAKAMQKLKQMSL